MTRAMRITTVISSLRGGGAERVCVNLANAWAAGGREVAIVTVSQRDVPPAYELDPGIEHRDVDWPRAAERHQLPQRELLAMMRELQRAGCDPLVEHVGPMLMLREAILATKPDVIVTHIDLTNFRVLAALEGSGIPIIACEHTDTKRSPIGKWQQVREVLYRRARVVVAPHASIADWLLRRGAPARAIANPLHPPPSGRTNGQGRRRLVTLTRLSREKRPEMLIRAFASIAAELPDWDLDLYGGGPLQDRVAARIGELGLEGRIRLHGFTTDPYAVLRSADLFASTSWVEGFGNAIWEALACGVPVVAMDCGEPVRTLARDGVDSLLVRTDTAPALADALASLMRDDAARGRLAARGPEVVARFPIASSLQAWDALLGEVRA